jgi:hypothetical protein
LQNYADDGTLLKTPLAINRATGDMTVDANLNVTGLINGMFIGVSDEVDDDQIGSGFLSFSGSWPLIVTTGMGPGTIIGPFTIPPDRLPNRSFYWTIQGNGLGEFFYANMTGPITLTPLALFAVEVTNGNGSARLTTPIAMPATLANISLSKGAILGITNPLFRYDPIVNTSGIQCEIFVSGTTIVTPFTCIFGIEGKIIRFIDSISLEPEQQPALPPPPPHQRKFRASNQ